MENKTSYLKCLFTKKYAIGGFKTSMVVGSILFAINHAYALVQGEMTVSRWLSAILTYLVPYCVQIWGQYQATMRSLNDTDKTKKAA